MVAAVAREVLVVNGTTMTVGRELWLSNVVLDDYDRPRAALDGAGRGAKVGEVVVPAAWHLCGPVLRSEQARVLLQAGVRQFPVFRFIVAYPGSRLGGKAGTNPSKQPQRP